MTPPAWAPTQPGSNARLQDGNADGTAVCDIGAYELEIIQPTPTPTPEQQAPAALPPTGGPAASGSGSPYALLAGVIAMAGAGGAIVAVRRRR
jgi:LPXTG-motif cell wall-anchored protein